jgi:WD40 repeat protein
MSVKKPFLLVLCALAFLAAGYLPDRVLAQTQGPSSNSIARSGVFQQASATPTPAPSDTATAAPSTPPVPYSELTANAIPLGKPLFLENDGGKKFSFQVNFSYLGTEADYRILRLPAPVDRRWVVIQVTIDYLKGPTTQGESLLNEDEFDIVSRGQILNRDYFKYTPSPTLDQIHLFPEKKGLGFLVYQFDASDPQPILRLVHNGKTYFFRLFTAFQSNELLKEANQTGIAKIKPPRVDFAKDKVGTKENPVPVGTTVSYQLQGTNTTLEMTIRKILRGYDAYKQSNDVWEIVGPPENGKEYIMPYFEIKMAGSDSQVFSLDDDLWSVISNGQNVEMNSYYFFCPMPCIHGYQTYLGGTSEGWLTRLVNQGDPNPLLVFNNQLYFSLNSGKSSEAGASSSQTKTFAAGALTYNNVNSIQVFKELDQKFVIHALAFSPDGATLAAGSDDRKIHLWNVADGTEKKVIDSKKIGVKSLAYSPDGTLLAAADIDTLVMVWDASSGEVVKEIKQGGKGIFVRFLPDNTLVSVDRNGIVTIWNPRTGEALKRYTTPRHTMDKSCANSYLLDFDMTPDGKTFAASLACGYASAWKPETGNVLFTSEDHRADSWKIATLSSVALSPQRPVFAFGSDFYHEGDLWLIDVADLDKNIRINSVGNMQLNIGAMSFSPEGSLLAAGLSNNIRVFWPEIPSGFLAGQGFRDLKAHKAQVTTLAFSNDDTLLASGDYKGKIILWNIP